MKSLTRRLVIAAAASLAFGSCAHAQDKSIVVASTTSTQWIAAAYADHQRVQAPSPVQVLQWADHCRAAGVKRHQCDKDPAIHLFSQED